MRTDPYAPPFKVGQRVRYTGRTSFSYGGHPMVEPGDEGVVVKNVEGQQGYPHLGREFARPLEGYSVVDIKGNRMAIDRDSTDHYKAIR